MGATTTTFGDKVKKFVKWWFTSEKPDEYQLANRTGLAALYRKELRDHFRSVRFIIILVLAALIGGISLYFSLNGIKDALAQGGTDFVFLKLFTISNASAPNFISLVALSGPFVGLALGFDAINGERSRGTLNRLVAQPIYRDSVINGKFLAGVTVITVMVFALGFVMSGVGLFAIGVPPSLDEIIRLLVFLIFTVVYMSLWLGISIFFSLLFRHAATSALTVFAIWLFFAIFLTLIIGMIAPVDVNTMSADVVIRNSTLSETISRLSPSNLYNEAVGTVMDPGTRALGLLGNLKLQSQQYAINAPLSLGQSLLLVWPHLTGLVALMLIFFAISYIVFMRQEIRA